MRRHQVTIDVVAAEAGVSTSTVSRVLNGHPGTVRVSAGACERVRAAAQRLRYVPNQAARSLARQRTGLIALLLWRLSGSLSAEIATGVANVAARHGYQVSVINAGAVHEEVVVRGLAYLCAGFCDGVVAASTSDRQRGRADDVLSDLVERGMPTTLVLDRSPDPAVPSIDIDHAAGTYLATKHLLGLGHRRIAAFVGADTLPTLDDSPAQRARYRGYLQALDEAGMNANPQWIFGVGRDMEGGRAMAHALLQRFPDPRERPTAVVAFDDQIAVGVLRGLYEIGIRVPEEIALIGFGGTLATRFTTPALTTVGHPRVELGELAAEALFTLLAAEEVKVRETIVPVSLVVRESCGALPRRDSTAGDHTGGA